MSGRTPKPSSRVVTLRIRRQKLVKLEQRVLKALNRKRAGTPVKVGKWTFVKKPDGNIRRVS